MNELLKQMEENDYNNVYVSADILKELSKNENFKTNKDIFLLELTKEQRNLEIPTGTFSINNKLINIFIHHNKDVDFFFK